MDDFDDFLDILPVVIPSKKRELVDSEICCGERMVLESGRRVCILCGQQLFTFTAEVAFATSHNSGASTNKPSMKVSKIGDKKSMIIYPSYCTDQEPKLKEEFKALKEKAGISDNIINTALYNYDNMLLKNNILKKKNNKKGIQIALIWIEHANQGIPRTKEEFCRLFDIPLNMLTKGYNFVYELDSLYNFGLIPTREDTVHHYVKRYRPDFESFLQKTRINIASSVYKIDRFLLNMANIVRDNHALHMNKHPCTLATSIILYTCDVYDYPLEYKGKTSVIKNVKAHFKYLRDLRLNETSDFYPYFKEIEDTFILDDAW